MLAVTVLICLLRLRTPLKSSCYIQRNRGRTARGIVCRTRQENVRTISLLVLIAGLYEKLQNVKRPGRVHCRFIIRNNKKKYRHKCQTNQLASLPESFYSAVKMCNKMPREVCRCQTINALEAQTESRGYTFAMFINRQLRPLNAKMLEVDTNQTKSHCDGAATNCGRHDRVAEAPTMQRAPPPCTSRRNFVFLRPAVGKSIKSTIKIYIFGPDRCAPYWLEYSVIIILTNLSTNC